MRNKNCLGAKRWSNFSIEKLPNNPRKSGQMPHPSVLPIKLLELSKFAYKMVTNVSVYKMSKWIDWNKEVEEVESYQ